MHPVLCLAVIIVLDISIGFAHFHTLFVTIVNAAVVKFQCLSYYYLPRLIMRIMGKSFIGYLVIQKLNEFCFVLLMSNMVCIRDLFTPYNLYSTFDQTDTHHSFAQG